jgi:hypothetical protein
MELKDIAAVSGKPGLFKILKPMRTGMVLESLDEKKIKIVTTPHHKVSVLHDISIYSTDYNKSIPLGDILKKIYREFKDDPGVDNKSGSSELRAFMEYIAPDHDPDRVYTSDIKKIVSWYMILYRECPELLKEEEKDTKEQPDKNPSGEEGNHPD